METTTETDLPAAPPDPRLITNTKYKGHAYCVFMHDADAFSFSVYTEFGAVLTESPAEHVSTNRAEMAAERWINDSIATKDDAREVGGWRITIFPEPKGGTFRAEVRRIDNAEPALEEFKGYLNRTQLQDEAMTWAAEHPCFAPTPVQAVDDSDDGVEDADEAGDSAPEPTVEPPPASSPAQATTRPPPDQRPVIKPPVRRPQVDEATDHAREHAQLVSELASLEEEHDALKATIKAKRMRQALLGKKMSDALLGKSEGTQVTLPLHEAAPQQPAPPFGSTPAAGDAAQLAADRLKPQRFVRTINAVEHEFVVRELEPNRWRAHIRGLDADTEGVGETYDQAVAACDGRASVYFSDCEPGSTTPSADASPLADGPASKPRRGRKPKLAGKGQDEVVAALRGAMHLGEAAKAIGCSEAELEDYARRVEIKLSDSLGRDTGEDEPPRSKRTAKKTPTNRATPASTKANNRRITGKRGRQ